MNELRTARRSKLKVLIFWNQLEDADPAAGSEPIAEPAAQSGEEVAAGEPAPVEAGAELEPAPAAAEAAEAEAEADADLADELEDDADADADAADADADAEDPLVRQVNDLAEALSSTDSLAVAAINIEDDIDRIIDGIVLERPSIIFNLVDQFYGDNTLHAAVASLFDLLGVAFTGSEPTCLSTCQERARTRLLLDNADIPIPGFAVVRDVNVLPDMAGLRYPLIVTQAFDDLYDEEGEAHPLWNREQLEERVRELAREFDPPLLIEEFVSGRRLHAIVLGTRGLEVLPISETVVRAHDQVEEVILAQLDADTADRVREVARRAFRVMGCRDCAQIDFHIDEPGNPYVIDVRPSFDFGRAGPLAISAEASDRRLSGVVTEIARQALRRARLLEEAEEGGARAAAAPAAPGDGAGADQPADAAADVADAPDAVDEGV